MLLAPHGSDVPGATHWYMSPKDVLFPFGAGLTYEPFALSWPTPTSSRVTVDADQWASGSTVPEFPFWVKNTGSIAAPFSVLGFISNACLTKFPLLKLFNFTRSGSLSASETVSVTLAVPSQVAAVVDNDGTSTLTPGEYTIQIGGDASSVQNGRSDHQSKGEVLMGTLVVTGRSVVIDKLPFQLLWGKRNETSSEIERLLLFLFSMRNESRPLNVLFKLERDTQKKTDR